MRQMTLLRSKTTIQLDQEIGRGGEGAVYAISGHNDRVAKIYSSPPDITKVQKLLEMVEAGTPALLRIAAWPIDLLTDKKGNVQGFLMPRIVSRRDIHELYSPKSRSAAFPEADFRFLCHVGANIARAFAVVHAHGQVIGDVNHGNLLVGADGTMMLIDCDSFQIGLGPNAYTCDVGVALFTAPELQGRSFRNLLRYPNHDLFALAVLLFHILYMGRHPFAGRYSGGGDMPIEKAIAEYRFAYGPDRRAKKIEQPPGTVALDIMGPEVAQNFTRAFSQAGSTHGRPDARKWISTLDKLKEGLRECPVAKWHHYPQGLTDCPWCTVESQTGVRLFGYSIKGGIDASAVDVAKLWQAITGVPKPGTDPILPSQRQWSPPPQNGLSNNTLRMLRIALSVMSLCGGLAACNTLGNGGGLIVALASFIVTFLVWPRMTEKKRQAIEQSFTMASTAWQTALARWNKEAKEELFTVKFKELERIHKEFLDLHNERRRRLARLEADRRQLQLESYLDRFRIDTARIPGIGQSRTGMLGAYGIETASDIDPVKIQEIPGFGIKITAELVSWRKEHERNFRFNPNLSIDPRLIDNVNREINAKQQAHLQTLRQGVTDLTRITQEVLAARSRLMPLLEKSWNEYKMAEARRTF